MDKKPIYYCDKNEAQKFMNELANNRKVTCSPDLLHQHK